MLDAGENAHVEFKERLPRPEKLAKTCVALANSGGGVILIGVADDRTVCGVDATLADVRRALDRVSFMTFPPVPTHVQALAVAGHRVIALRVRGDLTPPYRVQTATGLVCYVRAGDSCMRASARVERVLTGGSALRRGRKAALPPKVAVFLRRKGRLTVADYARLCNFSMQRAGRALTELVRSGAVTSYQEGPHEYFR